MVRSIKQVLLLAVTLVIYSGAVVAMDNTSRYLPYSVRPEKSWHKKESTLDVDMFYASGYNIANEDAAPIGFGEVMGRYDLQQIIFAMNEVGKSTQEVKQFVGTQFANSPLLFNIHGKLRSGGLALNYAWKIPGKVPVVFGASLPVTYTESDFRYSLDFNNFGQQFINTTPRLPLTYPTLPDATTWASYQERFDHARRIAHDTMGLDSNYWTHTGIGDLALFVRSNFVIDHRFLMRTIDLATEFGLVVPSGVRRSSNSAPSIPMSNDGHWSVYAQFQPTFELKQDIKLGLFVRGQHLSPQTRERQLSVFKEPFIYSPLKGAVRVQPGSTLLCGGFLALENLYDGLHLQGRYTYKKHNADKWSDARTDKTIPSYLSRTPTAAISQDEINAVISAKEYLSKYRSHYITIQLTYDPAEKQQDLPMKPKFYASFEAPFFEASRGIVQTNQISIGTELHF